MKALITPAIWVASAILSGGVSGPNGYKLCLVSSFLVGVSRCLEKMLLRFS